MPKKDDNTLLIVGGIVAAFLLLRPKRTTSTPVAYYPTTTGNMANTGPGVNNIISQGANVVASIINAIKNNKPKEIYTSGGYVQDDPLDYTGGGGSGSVSPAVENNDGIVDGDLYWLTMNDPDNYWMHW